MKNNFRFFFFYIPENYSRRVCKSTYKKDLALENWLKFGIAEKDTGLVSVVLGYFVLTCCYDFS